MSPIRLGKASIPPGGVQPGTGAEPPVAPATGDLRGYDIGGDQRPKVAAKKKEKGEPRAISPVILFAAAAAAVVLVLVIVIGPSRPGAAGPADEDVNLVASYKTYLAQRRPPPPDADQRVREVESRLEAIGWAERVGRPDLMRRELDLLLMLDGDRDSPVYRYASRRLARL